MNPFLPEIPFFCIHLERAKEREGFMTHFQNTLQRPITVWPASEGSEVAKLGWPRKHPIEQQTSDGALGCLDSHLRLLQHMIDMKYQIMGIFEDDAEMNSSCLDLQEFYKEVSLREPKWDIMILGANEWVDFTKINNNVVKPSRFWGTHAFLITLEAAKKVIQTHKELQAQGKAFPADWLYSYSISKYNLVAYGPIHCKKFIRQKPGLVSAINGKVRT